MIQRPDMIFVSKRILPQKPFSINKIRRQPDWLWFVKHKCTVDVKKISIHLSIDNKLKGFGKSSLENNRVNKKLVV
jgi:hypothetical protein